MASRPLDLGGNDLIVNSITTGASMPNTKTSTGSNSLVGGTGSANTASVTTTTLSPTSTQTGTIFTLNSLTGSTITLPAAVVGTTYKFIVGTVCTSNTYKIITPSSVFLAGGLNFDKSLTVTRYDADGSTIRSVNLNGTTTGGASIGDTFSITCVTSTVWTIEGTVTASGTLATPFATS
jgi:hypothetical protein